MPEFKRVPVPTPLPLREKRERDATGQLVAINKEMQDKAKAMLEEMGVPEEEIPDRLAEILANRCAYLCRD